MEITTRLWFFGVPHAEAGGQLMAGFESRKAWALLGYLDARGAALPRDQLVALLWPDHPEARGRANLRHLLHNLQTVLPGCLVVDRHTVQLAGAPTCWVDTAAFAECVAQDTLAALASAAALYHGPFLDGLYLDDCPEAEAWLTQERERWHTRAAHVLADLATRYGERQEWEAGLRAVDQLLALDAWREAAHRTKMRLLALSGQRDSALAQYDACRRVLRNDLGTDPSDETSALYDDIRKGVLTPVAAPVAHSVHLPIPPTPLLGRADERTQIGRLLADPTCRLVTLVGPGGIGKTRLALAVAAGLRNTFAAIYFVDLAPVSDAGQVVETIARTLAVREIDHQPLHDSVKSYLRDKHALLLLDNFEQVIAAAPLVAELLAACPHLTVLATSRHDLRVRGEHVFPVVPLAFPRGQDELDPARVGDYAAVALFVERATHHQPSFTLSAENVATVTEICRRLDGLPLAIELAAARIRLFPPTALLLRLNNRLDVLTRGPHDVPTRQQTLQNTLDWSYNLLDSAEQTLFVHLAVFVGGWTVGAVSEVCGDVGVPHGSVLDALQGLLDNHLVQQELDADGWPRFMLLETIREYAQMRLARQDDAAQLRRRHAAYYLAVAETAHSAQEQSDGVRLAQIEADYDNLRAAFQWMLECKDGEGCLRLCKALHGYWHSRGQVSEGRHWLRAALTLPGVEVYAPRADAFAAASGFAFMQGDWTEAVTLLEQALTISRALGDTWHITGLLREQGWLALMRGAYAEATEMLEESVALYRSLDDQHGIASGLSYLGQAAYEQQAFAQALPLLTESLTISRMLDDHIAVAWALNKLGLIALYQRRLPEAGRLLEESLAIFVALKHTGGIAWGRGSIGWVRLGDGAYACAAELFADSLVYYGERGDKRNIAFGLERLASLAALQRQASRAARLFGAAVTLRQQRMVPLPPVDQTYYTQYLAMVREHLSTERFAAVWAEGAAFPTRQAIAYALRQEDPFER